MTDANKRADQPTTELKDTDLDQVSGGAASVFNGGAKPPAPAAAPTSPGGAVPAAPAPRPVKFGR
jgi:hypothetical protein